METRILVPNGLKVVVTEVTCKRKSRSRHELQITESCSDKTSATEDEKPSSSSGHFETQDSDHLKSSSASPVNYSSSEDEDNRKGVPSSSASSTPGSLSETSDNDDNDPFQFSRGKSTPKSEGVIGSSERGKRFRSRKQQLAKTQIRICASRTIAKGTVFTPHEGDVQVVHFKDFPAIAENDIRFIFGCFENVTSAPSPLTPTTPDALISSASSAPVSNSNLIRLCNWVRFLHLSGKVKAPNNNTDSEDDSHEERSRKRGEDDYSSNSIKDSAESTFVSGGNRRQTKSGSNIVGRFVGGHPVFEVVASLVPGTELVAYFDMDSLTQFSQFRMMMDMPIFPTSIPSTTSSSSSPPPRLSEQQLPSSSHISSSSSLLGFVCNNGWMTGADRDEKAQQRLMPLYPYAFHFPGQQSSNAFRLLSGSSGGDNPSVGHKRDSGGRVEDEGKSKEKIHSALLDGPLDLSKFTNLIRPSVGISDPLKIGTPFDSPDSNDGSKEPLITPAKIGRREACSSSGASFSIRNVLKQPSHTSKLFQPYSLEIEKESSKNRAMLLTPPSSMHTAMTSLGTPPSIGSSSHSPIVVRNSPVLRPILRTRGRERSLLPCEVCGKAFDRPSLLKRHLRTHTGEKPHICDVCSKGFSTSSSLNTHRRIHSGEKPHQCPICGKRFTASSNLYYHRMTHNKEKPHKCILCGKSFPTPGDLKSHQYVHSGSWPHTCPVCHRGFSKQTNLRNHLLLHSGMGNSSSKPGDKPHTCQICDKKFALACNLRAHLRTHEEDPPVSSCSVCKRTFLSSLNMLVNGRCRSCLLTIPGTNDTTTAMRRESASPSASGEGTRPLSNNDSTLLATHHRISSAIAIPSLSGQTVGNPMQLGSLAMPQIPGFSVPLPGSLALTRGLHFPSTSTGSSSNSAAAAAAAAGLLRTGASISTPANPASNPFLEQLFEWNYRFAKETAGNLSLSIMQQKLLESQVLAAQLMSVSANTSGFGVSDILRLRPADFPSLNVPNESKFM